MSSTERRNLRVPLLERIARGTAETNESPGIDDSGQPVLRPGEMVLFESRTFPSIRTMDAASGEVHDTDVPGDGGVTLITNRRVIFMREKCDTGVAASHFRFGNVDSLRYKRARKLDAAVGVFDFTVTNSSGTFRVEVRARKAPHELRDQVVEAVSIAHHVEQPIPSGQPGGWENWAYTRVRPSNPEDRYRDLPPSRLADPPADVSEPPAMWPPPSVD